MKTSDSLASKVNLHKYINTVLQVQLVNEVFQSKTLKDYI